MFGGEVEEPIPAVDITGQRGDAVGCGRSGRFAKGTQEGRQLMVRPAWGRRGRGPVLGELRTGKRRH